MIAPVTRAAAPPVTPANARVARDFEALIIVQLLKSAHAAQLADDPLTGDTSFRDLRDQQLAQAIAQSSPLGVARLLK